MFFFEMLPFLFTHAYVVEIRLEKYGKFKKAKAAFVKERTDGVKSIFKGKEQNEEKLPRSSSQRAIEEEPGAADDSDEDDDADNEWLKTNPTWRRDVLMGRIKHAVQKAIPGVSVDSSKSDTPARQQSLHEDEPKGDTEGVTRPSAGPTDETKDGITPATHHDSTSEVIESSTEMENHVARPVAPEGGSEHVDQKMQGSHPNEGQPIPPVVTSPVSPNIDSEDSLNEKEARTHP